MPWLETCSMDEKMKFVTAWLSGGVSMTDLCRSFGISRKTGYKWVQRYEDEGPSGLIDRSCAPHHHPNALDATMAARLLYEKQRRPNWGPRKIRARLVLDEPLTIWPSASAVGNLFHRHGLVKPRGRRKRVQPHTEPLRHCTSPNEVWSADFKGQFQLRDTNRWLYPLTVFDNHSRYLLACRGVSSTRGSNVWPWFERLFREYGLPAAMRTDNGTPFASTALGGLSRLAVWWLKLGIIVERIEPGHPEQNGRHERMHRTLKADAITPPQRNEREQQRSFDRFVREYNEERPHESLDDVPPAYRYERSPRRYPRKIPTVEYGLGFTVRKVRTAGDIRWKGGTIYVSEALCGEPVGLRPLDNYRWELYFSRMMIGVLDERLGKIMRHDK